MSASEVNKLLDDILQNPDKPVGELTQQQLADVKRRINLYGVVVPANEAWANFSVVNNSETYMRRLITTSLIGYLFRVQAEYLKSELADQPADDEIFNAFGLTSAEYSAEQINVISAKVRTWTRGQIAKFLKYNFNYDPDRHVSSAYKDNLDDPERAGKFDKMRADMETKGPAVVPADDLFNKLNNSLTPEQQQLLAEYKTKMTAETALNSALVFTKAAELQTIATKVNHSIAGFAASNPFADLLTVKEIRDAIVAKNEPTNVEYRILELTNQYLLTPADSLIDTSDLTCILARNINALNELTTSLRKGLDVSTSYNNVPPGDLFYHFDRYLTNHYELLREATQIIYCEKPDIEFAVQFYGKSHDTKEEAVGAVSAIRDRVSTAVYTVSNEGWFLLGPFKQNRDRIEFYNKNTEILKRMMEQAESDSKLGADLMKKRVVRNKEKNIIEAGPDDPGLAKYQDAVGIVEKLGSKPALSKEEKEKLAEAINRKEMTEVPSNAIQVDIHKPVTDASGNVTLQRSVFYTEAEAPKFMEEQLAQQRAANEAVANGADPATALKQVRDRHGKIMSLADLKNNIKPAASANKS